jgi:hypothetical protein
MLSQTASAVDAVCGIMNGLATKPITKPTTSITTTRPIVIIFAMLFFSPALLFQCFIYLSLSKLQETQSASRISLETEAEEREWMRKVC